jgi:hypothetical protein
MASIPDSTPDLNSDGCRRYRVPVECASDVDDLRLVHEDLPALDDDQLLVEGCRVVAAIAAATARADLEWLVARYRRVGAEQRQRANAKRQPVRRRTAPPAPPPAAPPVPASRAALAALSDDRE